MRYVITPERGLLGAKTSTLLRARDCLHDRMTETVVDAGFDGQALFQTLAGKPMRTVAVQARGAEALVEANATLGLALSDDEIEYLASPSATWGATPPTSS